MCSIEQTRPPFSSYDRPEVKVGPTILLVLVLGWVLGVATSSTFGGLIHLLLVVALVLLMVRVIEGGKPFAE